MFDFKKARRAQIFLASKVIKESLFNINDISIIGGLDVAYYKDFGIGAAVALSYNDLKVIDKAYSIVKIKIPYVPTFLAFREVYPMITALLKLKVKPDVTLVDAHGIMHPRRLGAASHIGVVLGIPTIGVAKSRLVGVDRGDGYIVDHGEIVGYKLNDKTYVSIGNMVSLGDAITIVRRVLKYEIPEPTRQAHIYANQIKNMVIKGILRPGMRML